MATQINSTAASVVAEVALYGNRQAGSGWIVAVNREVVAVPDGFEGLIGTGALAAGQSFTEALWTALDHLVAVLPNISGLVRVFAPGGHTMAHLDVADTWPAFGDLKFESAYATWVTLDVKAIEAAAL